MAKQSGVIKLKGTIGDVTFYKSKDGHLAREKGGVSKERIANDPAFQRTRENGKEFGRAGKASRLLRTAFRALLLNTADSRVTSRLTAALMKVVKSDTTNGRGDRNVIDGTQSMLLGFEFNNQGKLGATMYAPYTATIDRETGELVVSIPAFVPENMVAAPAGTTHIKIVAAGAEVDFANDTFVVATQASAFIPWNGVATALTTLTCELTPESVKPEYLVLGVEFYQEVNSVKYPLKNGAYNSLAIVKIDA